MKLFQSIRFRIVMACVIFSIIVTLCYGWVTFYGVKYNSDELFNWYISQESEQLIASYQADPSIEFSELTTANIMISQDAEVIKLLAGYFENPEVEQRLRNISSLAHVPIPGPEFTTAQGYDIYEYSDGGNTVHVLKSTLNNTSNNFYYIVDVSLFTNYDNNSERYIADLFTNILIVIVLLALLIGFVLAQMVLTPLTRLANSVESIDYDTGQMPARSERYFDDEIGFLAKKVDSFVKRTNQFVAREKAFTRDASHELRTPVASSRAALELALSTSEGNQTPIKKFLDRAMRANKDMTHLIETFLILGREDKEQPRGTTFNLHQLINSALKKHDYLKKNLDIECINRVDTTEQVIAVEQILSIVVDNLVRNAFQHTDYGMVCVDYDGQKIIVQDTGEGISSSATKETKVDVLNKSGVGLSIVRRLCEKQDWQLEITSEAGQGTCVKIDISTKP